MSERKSLGQVAYEDYHAHSVSFYFHEEPIRICALWDRLAKAVIEEYERRKVKDATDSQV